MSTGAERDAARTEQDVAEDPGTAGARVTGGDPASRDEDDAASTTGTAPNEEFVGRTAGATGGDEQESGAEVRAQGGTSG